MPRSSGLRIGFDGGVLANRRGFGRFARELLLALAEVDSAHQLVVVLDEPSFRSGSLTIPERCEVVPVRVRQSPSQAASAEGRRSVSDMLAMGRAAAGARLDTFLFPSSYSFYPVWNVGPVVTTIFDTMPLDFPDLIFTRARHRWAWAVKERMAVWRSRHLLTTSEYSRSSIQRHYGQFRGQIHVIPCAASSLFQPVTDRTPIASILSKYAIDGRQPYFLYVGGLSPHKNLLRLIDAFAMLSERNAQLVLVGDLGDVFRTHVPELRARVKDRRLDGKVVFTGYVPDEDLVWLYNGALALVQPSLIEGFGLPPVEAMACGTPVIASTAGSLPEVVGDAGIAFEPTDVDALAEAMQRLIADYALRAEFACRATERAQSFRWSHAARQVLEVMSQAAMHQVAA